MARTSATLWRLILTELIRLLVFTSAALVGIIAFAAAIKPLADGQIRPGDALSVMGLFAVPMLQFALPFAAGFSATLTYHRLAADNEASAAMASGISHRALLAPAAVTGVLVGVVLLALSGSLIPAFLRSAEHIITRDAIAAFLTPLKDRGQAIQVGRMSILAADVDELTPMPERGELRCFRLHDVFAAETDPGNPLRSMYLSADLVDCAVLAIEAPDGSDAQAVQFRFANADGLMPRGRISGETISLRPIRIPGNIFDDDPKFLGFGELLEAARRPRMLNVVDSRCRRLIAEMAEHLAAAELQASLERLGEVTLARPGDQAYTTHTSPDTYTIAAARVTRAGGTLTLEPITDAIRIRASLAGGVKRSQQARGATLTVHAADEQTGEPTGRLRITAVFEGITTLGAGPVDAQRAEQVVAGLAPPTDHLAALGPASAESLVSDARLLAGDPAADTDRLNQLANIVESRVERLRREIRAKLHERFAFATASTLMVLTGAVMALRLRDSLPLPVYLWSFCPALFAVITISAGQSMTHARGPAGLALLWGGVAALGVFTLVQYRRLARR